MDGVGLYLEVLPSGGKHWRHRFRIDGKESTHAIGKHPAIKAAEVSVKNVPGQPVGGCPPCRSKEGIAFRGFSLHVREQPACCREQTNQ